jgi:hypothetical protein
VKHFERDDDAQERIVRRRVRAMPACTCQARGKCATCRRYAKLIEAAEQLTAHARRGRDDAA